jgi:uncharacterized RDD family membrane protein YckC
MLSHLSTPNTPGIGRRMAAMSYDCLLLAALWFAISALLLAASDGLLTSPDRPQWLLYFHRFCLILVTVLFYTGFWTHGGQTLGMRAWRLKIVANDGQPVNWIQALWRFTAAIPSIGLFGIGFLWMLLDRERRTLHDRLSGTRFVLLAKNA